MPTFQTDSIEIHYDITGEGEPILFIHGLGSSSRDWEDQVSFFSKNYQVLTVDVRGHGKSEKPPGPYSISQFALDIASLIKFLNISPLHVVGISMGGMISFQLATTEPELFKSLTAVNSAPEFIPRKFKEHLQVLQRLLIFKFLSMEKIGNILSKKLFPKPHHEKIAKKFVKRWAENDKRAYMDSMRAILGWGVADQLDKIDCPVLVLASDQDYTTVESKEAFVAKIKNAELVVIDDTRHALPVEEPEKFNQALSVFLLKQNKMSENHSKEKNTMLASTPVIRSGKSQRRG